MYVGGIVTRRIFSKQYSIVALLHELYPRASTAVVFPKKPNAAVVDGRAALTRLPSRDGATVPARRAVPGRPGHHSEASTEQGISACRNQDARDSAEGPEKSRRRGGGQERGGQECVFSGGRGRRILLDVAARACQGPEEADEMNMPTVAAEQRHLRLRACGWTQVRQQPRGRARHPE